LKYPSPADREKNPRTIRTPIIEKKRSEQSKNVREDGSAIDSIGIPSPATKYAAIMKKHITRQVP
jgi:hypothetical protein